MPMIQQFFPRETEAWRHINAISFFPSYRPFPHHKKSFLMSQAGLPLFPIPQQRTTVSYGDVLNTPTLSHDHLPLHGSGSPGSGLSISPDNSLLSSAPISLFSNISSTSSSSFSPGSPQAHAYSQLARQYQDCQQELKKVNHEYGRLKYVFIL
jgi:hypothetical protein